MAYNSNSYVRYSSVNACNILRPKSAPPIIKHLPVDQTAQGIGPFLCSGYELIERIERLLLAGGGEEGETEEEAEAQERHRRVL